MLHFGETCLEELAVITTWQRNGWSRSVPLFLWQQKQHGKFQVCSKHRLVQRSPSLKRARTCRSGARWS